MDFTYARREGGDATDKTGCLRGGRFRGRGWRLRGTGKSAETPITSVDCEEPINTAVSRSLRAAYDRPSLLLLLAHPSFRFFRILWSDMMKDFGWLFAIIPPRDFSLLNVRDIINNKIKQSKRGKMGRDNCSTKRDVRDALIRRR